MRAAVLALVRREFGMSAALHFPEVWGPRIVVEARLNESSVFIKVAADTDVDAELTTLSLARAAGVPVPDVVAAGTDPLVPGGKWIALAQASGTFWPFEDDALPARTFADLADILARLSNVHRPGFGPLTADGVGTHASWREWLLESAKSYLDPLVASGLATERLAAQALSAFATAPQITLGALVHCDITPSHLLADPDTGKVTCLIDWGAAVIGDPVYELAKFVAGGPADDPCPEKLLPQLVEHLDADLSALPLYQAHNAIFNAEWSRREDIPWAPALLDKAAALL